MPVIKKKVLQRGGRASRARLTGIRAYKSWASKQTQHEKMPAARPTHQFRFVETRTTSAPGLSQSVKYIATYPMDSGKLAVLAQGKDKYTLRKWAGLLRVRQDSVAPVNDMNQALENARKQGGLVEQGTFSYQRGGFKTLPAEKQARPREVQPAMQEDESAKQEKEEIPAMYLVARAAAQQMAVRLEEREQARLPHVPEDFETDVDNLYPRASAGSARDFSKNVHLAARQAALQYIQRLQDAGRLFSRDSIPRGLRDGWCGETRAKHAGE